MALYPTISTARSRNAKRSDSRPNIIILFTDDMGYNDLSVINPEGPPTPNIDSIANDGIRFTDGYVAQAWCGPSRAGLLTGRHPRRFGFTRNYSPIPRTGDKREVTIADLMVDAGYVAGMVAKYGNLGGDTEDDPRARPMDHGFQECYWAPAGDHDNIPKNGEPYDELFKDEEPVTDETGFLPLVWGREAVSFINRHKDEPFFLYVPFNQPHNPVEATQEYLDRFSDIADVDRRTYFALMSGLDDAVGMILDALKQNGLDEDTIVFFSNDNGSRPTGGMGSSPLRGGKRTCNEGGVRVPTFCRWTGHFDPGTVYPHPVSTLDLLPTAAALAGIDLPEDTVYDGVNLIPYLDGTNNGVPHEALVWFKPKTNELEALRAGDWKIIKDDDVWYLNHLPTNPGEKTKFDKKDEEPELFNRLLEAAMKAQEQILADEALQLDLGATSTPSRDVSTHASYGKMPRHWYNGQKHRFEFPSSRSANREVAISDPSGRRIVSLRSADSKGVQFFWDGTDGSGKRCAGGMYLISSSGPGGSSSLSFHHY